MNTLRCDVCGAVESRLPMLVEGATPWRSFFVCDRCLAEMERVTPDGHCRGCGAFDLFRRDVFFLCDRCLDERLDAAQARRQVAPVAEVDHLRALGELRAAWLGRGVEER